MGSAGSGGQGSADAGPRGDPCGACAGRWWERWGSAWQGRVREAGEGAECGRGPGTRRTQRDSGSVLAARGPRRPPQAPCTGGGADPLRAFSRASLSYWCVRSPPQAEDARKDVSLYFSGDKWAPMGDGEKGRHWNLQRNLDVLLSRGRALAPGRRSLVTRRAAGRAAAVAAPSRINDEGGICSFARAALRVQRLQQLLVDSPIPWEPVTRASWGSFLLQARCFQD